METPTPIKPNGKGSFRDSISTVDEDGKRVWIYPKKPKGKYYNRRWAVSSVLLLLLLIGPWIRYKGEPFLLLNILERKFILFGQLFWPQDFHLVVLSVITFIVFIILFTVIFGRLFCGWACPQTIFMEFVFRQIEYLIEGDYNQQKKLNRQTWDFEKTWKKSLKHFLFFGIAFVISNTFLAYIIGTDRLMILVTEGPIEHFGSFIALIIFSAVFYFIFAFFREQVCIIVCPYGRLQGVLLDNKSIVVAYDYKRGEPRGKHNPLEDRTSTDKGDCIDCSSCVVVCPTGIDIRNGTQLECINCTACIDACDAIMEKVKLPTGLIRYASEKSIAEGFSKIFNARSIAYSAVLTVLLMLVGTLFVFRSDIEATIVRVPGTLFQEYGAESYSNVFKIQLVNKTRETMKLDLQLLGNEGKIIMMGDSLHVPGGKMAEANFLIVLPKNALTSSALLLNVGVFSEGKEVDKAVASFIGPNIYNN